MCSLVRKVEQPRDGDDDGKDTPVQNFTEAVVAHGAALDAVDHLRLQSSIFHIAGRMYLPATIRPSVTRLRQNRA